MAAVTKFENAELERNKKIFMNTNNILYKTNLNPLAKEFTPLNILPPHKFILNPLAKEFTPSVMKSDEIKNNVIDVNFSPENGKILN